MLQHILYPCMAPDEGTLSNIPWAPTDRKTDLAIRSLAPSLIGSQYCSWKENFPLLIFWNKRVCGHNHNKHHVEKAMQSMSKYESDVETYYNIIESPLLSSASILH